MKGVVVKSTGSWYLIKNDSGEILKSRIKGRFRLDNIGHTNPVAVGDHVDFELDNDGIGVITKIYERKNYIIRQSVNLSKRTHIIASNIDRAFLIVTLDNPKTSTGFIDRFLVTAEAYHIPVSLIVNKMDAYNDNTLKEVEKLKKIYLETGYEVIEVSALTNYHLDELKSKLKGIVSLFAGHSGVGKSTLMNRLHPELNIKTSEISDFNKKGQHTTTFAEMHQWPFGGYCIDTPGIKEFGLADMESIEIQQYFPEIRDLRIHCRFDNCMHINEPDCAVREAAEQNKISESRYTNYLRLIDETEVR